MPFQIIRCVVIPPSGTMHQLEGTYSSHEEAENMLERLGQDVHHQGIKMSYLIKSL